MKKSRKGKKMTKNPVKGLLRSEHIQRREFSYAIDDVTLNFTLRTDVKVELKKFSKLLEQAVKDVNEEIKN